MTTKLTLSIDETIIDELKTYSRKEKISISKLAERYFRSIIDRKKKKKSFIEKYAGILKDFPIEKNDPFYKKTTSRLIEEKYRQKK